MSDCHVSRITTVYVQFKVTTSDQGECVGDNNITNISYQMYAEPLMCKKPFALLSSVFAHAAYSFAII